MSQKPYQIATQGYDSKTHEQKSQIMLVADAIANGHLETLKILEQGRVINLNGLSKKLEDKL